MPTNHSRPDLLQCLRYLDDFDTARNALKTETPQLAALSSEIETLRQCLPTAILKHYDQRRANNRPALASVKRGTCGICRVSLPPLEFEDLLQNEGAIHVCENCGVFIYLDDRESAASEASSR